MRKYLILLFISSIFICCNDSQKDKTNTVANNTDTAVIVPKAGIVEVDNIPVKKERKLRYLFVANGGTIGYFDDGTVTGCARCEIGVEELSELEPYGTYIVEEGGTLLVDGEYREYPHVAREGEWQDWKMIDYKWIEQSDKEE